MWKKWRVYRRIGYFILDERSSLLGFRTAHRMLFGFKQHEKVEEWDEFPL